MLRALEAFEQCAVGATDGEIGHVKDLYFDDHAWVIRYLIVDTGSWLSRRKVLITPISIQKPDWPAHRLAAAITREQVKNSPEIDTEKPVYRQHEVRYLGYYGYPGYWGGAGLWGGAMIPFGMGSGQAALPLGAEAGEQATASAEIDRERHRNDDPHLRSCNAVVGYDIHATDGDVGHVDGFLIDDETWSIRYLIVNTSNWWVGHQVLIAPQWTGDVSWSDRTVSVDLSREAVKTAPAYDPSVELDRQRETALHTHHDRLPYWKAASSRERQV